MDDKEKEDDSIFKSKYYFGFMDAVDDVLLSQGAKETSVAGVKLLGKTLFNTALFAGKAGVEIVKQLPNALAGQVERNLSRNENIDPEKRVKMEEFVEKYKRPPEKR